MTVMLTDGTAVTIKFAYRRLGLIRWTDCILLFGTRIVSATARCARGDNFCRETGRKIALSRAIQKAIDRSDVEDRERIWDRYFSRDLPDARYGEFTEMFPVSEPIAAEPERTDIHA